jgi:mono/diheme cytochrome c family protein
VIETWRNFPLAISIAIFVIVILAGAALPSEPDSVQAGRRLFAVNCAICHGAHGDGKGEVASKLKTLPRDLTKGVYEFRSTGSSQLPTDDDLARTITFGIPSTAMVPQGDLGDVQIRRLVDYIKTLSDKFSKNSIPKPLPIPPPPANNKAAVSAGRKLYQESGCIECHGVSARGDGPSASKLSVKPADLTQRPLKSGASAKDIVRTILTGLDGTTMPSFHQVLPEEKIWLMAFYVQSLGKAPVLTGDERIGREILRQIRAAKPSR